MTAPQPQTTFNDLLEQATAMMFARERDELKLRLIEREADTLIRVDAGEGWQIKGYCAAIRGNLDKVQAAFRNAIRLRNDTPTWLRFAQALIEVGGYAEARDVLFERFPAARDDLLFLRTGTTFLGSAGWLDGVEKFNAQLVALGQGTAIMAAGFSDWLGAHKYSADDIQAPIGFARRYLKERGLDSPRSQSRFGSLNDDGQLSLIYEIVIDAQPEEVADIEFELYTALAEQGFRAEEECALLVSLASGTDRVETERVEFA